MTNEQPTEWLVQLRLRALPGEVPGVVRLRRLLKTALRVFRLQAISVQSVPSRDAATTAKED